MKMWSLTLAVLVAALTSMVGTHPLVAGSQGTPAPSGKASWEAQIRKAERTQNGLQLDISFRHLGTEAEVPPPLIKVRDATGAEWPAASQTKGGRDKDCIVWLSMSAFLVLGVQPLALPKEKVDSCQDEVLTYFFGPPRSAKPPFELLFADAPAVIVKLN
jgi:hypothetical protein